MTSSPTTPQVEAPEMTHREILEAMSGLLVAMFVAMLSSTVVSNALPKIVADLHGTQTGYTWVVVATMLAMTATTPVWGKLADQFSKKMLMQISMLVYVSGSALAGLSQSMEMLISARVLTGIGVGGVMSLIQIIIAAMVPPRRRGKYAGYLGASFALATVSGPLIGGLIVDSRLGWRGCFYVGLPFAIASVIILHFKLHLPVVKRKVTIDYLGAVLIAGGVSALLIWVSLAGQQFDVISPVSGALLGLGIVTLALAIVVEAKVAQEPIIPLELFANRAITLATMASVFVGLVMFGSTVYLSEYFQASRGMTPTEAGMMSLCMVAGVMFASIISGRVISNTGRWKRWIVGGTLFMTAGTFLLGTINADTSLVAVGIWMALAGLGVGATQQNLIITVQNNVPMSQLGAASSLVAFFRSLGGSIGVSALGAVLSHQVASRLDAGVRPLMESGQVKPSDVDSLGGGALPTLSDLPDPLAHLFSGVFAESVGHVFWIAAPCAAVAFLCVIFMKETPLRTTMSEPVEQPELSREDA